MGWCNRTRLVPGLLALWQCGKLLPRLQYAVLLTQIITIEAMTYEDSGGLYLSTPLTRRSSTLSILILS